MGLTARGQLLLGALLLVSKSVVPAVLAAPASGSKTSTVARVAFLQRGVQDSDAALLHTPRVSKRITSRQLSTAISRVLCLDASADVGSALPSGDLFNRPNANIIVFVDGISPQGTSTMPFVRSALRSKGGAAYDISTAADTHMHGLSLLQSALRQAGGDLHSAVTESAGAGEGALYSVVCGSAAGVLLEQTEACDSRAQHMAVRPLSDTEYAVLRVQAMLSGWDPVSLTSENADGSKMMNSELQEHSAEFDAVLLQELALLADLSLHVRTHIASSSNSNSGSSDSGSSSKATVAIMYLSTVQAMSEAYGPRHAKTRVAARVLDAALRNVVDDSPAKLTVQIIAGPALAHVPYHPSNDLYADVDVSGHRRLHSTSASSNDTSAANVTLIDITQYQLNLWTGVFFALLVLAAIYAVATMDIGRDSLLYAKFQADTTGKMD